MRPGAMLASSHLPACLLPVVNCTDRGVRMYERDKNSPAILMWSLGNESGAVQCGVVWCAAAAVGRREAGLQVQCGRHLLQP